MIWNLNDKFLLILAENVDPYIQTKRKIDSSSAPKSEAAWLDDGNCRSKLHEWTLVTPALEIAAAR